MFFPRRVGWVLPVQWTTAVASLLWFSLSFVCSAVDRKYMSDFSALHCLVVATFLVINLKTD